VLDGFIAGCGGRSSRRNAHMVLDPIFLRGSLILRKGENVLTVEGKTVLADMHELQTRTIDFQVKAIRSFF